MSITSMTNRARMAENLTIEQLQQSIRDGVVPSYIGVPLLKSKVEDAKLLQAAKMAQNMGPQPSVAQQIMAQAQQVEQGVPALPTNLPVASMAGGGIVAFAEGGMYDDEDSDEERQDAARQAEMDELMDEYAQTFQAGIGQLPAAAVAVPAAREGIAGGDAADFIAKIMHKESRGRRYGRDGELLTSEKGAKGEMQVMPGTSRDPGFGVKPARDDSPDELARVGRDYAQTLLARYGDPKLAAIAYNMGPGATDKWLAAGADASKLPKETQGYVKGFSGEDGESEVKDRYKGLWPYNSPDAGKFRYGKDEELPRELTDNEKRYAGVWPYNAPEAGKFSYTDAAKFDARKKDEKPTLQPKGNAGITYAPNTGMGNVTPTRYVPKESNERESEMMRAVKYPFRAIGEGLASLYSNKAGMPSDTDYTASGDLAGAIMGERTGAAPVASAPVTQQNIPSIPRGRQTMVNDPRLIGAVQPEVAAAESTKETPSPSIASSPAAVGQVAVVDPYAEFKELFAKREASLAKQREQDKAMAILQAGLGMMGGTSQHALANIGAGATQGIQSLAEARKLAAAEENALLSGRLGLAKIAGTKEYQDQMMKMRRELADQTNARLKQSADASGEAKAAALLERKDAKTYKLLSDIEDKIRASVSKDIAGDVVLQNKPNIEQIKEQMVQDRLRAHKMYGRKYQEYFGEPAFDAVGGGGSTSDNAGWSIKPKG